MPTNQKLETQFRAALNATPEERAKSEDLSTGFNSAQDTWEVIVKHTGNLASLADTYPQITIIELLNNYGILRLPANLIDTIVAEEVITYMEKPKRLFFEVTEGKRASCINSLQARYPDLSGKGTLVGVIDSGIDYSHPDFRNSDGTTRIRTLWDQTIPPDRMTTNSIDTFYNSEAVSHTMHTNKLQHPHTLNTFYDSKTVSQTLQINNPQQLYSLDLLHNEQISSQALQINNPQQRYSLGTFYDSETINQALQTDDPQQRYSICPSQDLSGHGTHVAGIAAGNGRASNGQYRGVAYESQLLIVKLGIPGPNSFPSTSLLMMGIDFCVRESLRLNLPLALNLSFGNTYGSHSGSSLLETYLDSVSELGRISIVAGSGNEGVSNGHTGGILSSSRPETIQFTISEYSTNLSIQLWKNFWDEFTLRLTPPIGNSVIVPFTPGAWRYSFDETEVYSYNGEPTPYSPFQEIYIDFLPANTYLTTGVWTIQLIPQRIRNGLWDMWMPSSAIRNEATAFLFPTPDTTLTIPSTAARVITVGAYDSNQNTYAAFSGRGFTWNNQFIKPDLVAPGVNITSCSPGGGYEQRTGTSMATPFVTGTASLLMQWGIIDGNDLFLYGEKLRAYLIRGAKPLPGFETYPNPQTGWGALCALDSL